MLSPRSLFQEILDHDESFRLFCSIAAGGEAQGGWENGRIAALVPGSRRALAPRIARHGADEDKHGRIFRALLRRRRLDPVEVPADTDCTMLLERRGIGLAHTRLRSEEPLTEQAIIVHLAHSRVTEQRAAEQMDLLRRHFGDHPDLGRGADDRPGRGRPPRLLPRGAAASRRRRARQGRPASPAPLRARRDPRPPRRQPRGHGPDGPGRILGWSRGRSALLAAGVRAVYGYERCGGWRRMVTLTMPERRDALGGPASPAPEYA